MACDRDCALAPLQDRNSDIPRQMSVLPAYWKTLHVCPALYVALDIPRHAGPVTCILYGDAKMLWQV